MHKLDTDNWLHSWVPGRAAKEEQLVARRGVLVAKGYRATVNVQPCINDTGCSHVCCLLSVQK